MLWYFCCQIHTTIHRQSSRSLESSDGNPTHWFNPCWHRFSKDKFFVLIGYSSDKLELHDDSNFTMVTSVIPTHNALLGKFLWTSMINHRKMNVWAQLCESITEGSIRVFSWTWFACNKQERCILHYMTSLETMYTSVGQSRVQSQGI